MPNPEVLGLDLDLAPDSPPEPTLAANEPLGLDLDLSPDADPVERLATRKLRDSFVRTDKVSLSQGEPVLDIRPDFAPHFSDQGTRNYISEWSKGLLDLNDTAFTKAQEDLAAAEETKTLFSRRPNLARVVGANPEFQQPLLSHIRALVRLRNTPASPREILDAGDAATSDWLKAAKAGTLTGLLGNLEVPADLINPAAARDLWAKVHAMPIAGVANRLSPSDRALYDALGGAAWFQFQKTRQPFYLGLARKEKLLGQPARDPAEVPTIQASALGVSGTVPEQSPIQFEDFERLSTFTQDLFARAQEEGVRGAVAFADERAAYAAQHPTLGPTLSMGLADAFGLLADPDRGVIGRAAFAWSNVLGAIAEGANRFVGPALNVLTLGTLNSVLEGASDATRAASAVGTGVYSLTQNLLEGRYDAAQDGDFLNKKTREAVTTIGRSLALGAKEGHDDRRAASELDFIETSFPDLDADAVRELRLSYFGGGQAIQGFMRRASEGALGGPLELFSKVFRTDSPYLQRAAGENIGPMLESPEGIAFTLLGASQLYNAIFRRSKLRTYNDPKRRGAVTDFDKHLAETGQLSQAPTAIRAGLLDEINAKIAEIPDAAAAGQFVERVQRAYRDHGAPITPGLKAKIDTAATLFKTEVENLQGRKISEAGKAALLDLAEPVASLHPIDQAFVVKGRDAFVNTAGSAEKVARLKKWYELQARTIEELELPREVDRSMEKMVSVQRGLIEHAQREADFVRQQSRFLEVTDTLVGDLAAKAQELQKSAGVHGALREASRKSWNDFIRSTARRNAEIETAGATVSRPNPRIKEPAFERLVTAVTDGGPKLEALLTDRDLAGPTRDAMAARLEGATDRAALIQEWARDEIRDRSAPLLAEFRATEKTAGIAEAIARAVEEAEAKGEPVTLTQAQKNWIDRHAAARGESLFKVTRAAADDALKATIEKATAEADKTVSLAEALADLQAKVREATTDTGRVKIPKKLRKEITEALEEFDIPVAKRHVALSTAASKAEISALEAFRESIDDLGAEHRALLDDVQQISSLEMAAMGKSIPHVVRHELDWLDRAAVGAENVHNHLAKVYDKLLGKEATPAERMRIFDDMKSGKPVTHEGAVLMQSQRIQMLADAVNAGVITAERYAQILGTPYAHNVFDRATQAEVANTLEFKNRRTPAGYSGLAVDPGSLRFRIPENGTEYVAWRDAQGKLHSKDGFAALEEATSWVEQNVAKGSEVTIAKTWPVVEKALSGLVEDAGISHLDMVEQLGLATHNARIGRFLSTTPYVRRASDVSDLVERGQGKLNSAGTVFETNTGERFLKWTNPHNPWLEGRFVSVEAVKWLEEFKTGYGFVRELNAAAQDAHPIKGDLLGNDWKVFSFLRKWGGGGLRAANRAFALRNVALSPGTIVKNWISNITTARFAGLNLLNPIEFAFGLKYALDGTRARLTSKTGLDDYWKDLAEADIVRFGDELDYHRSGPGAEHSRSLERALDKDWRALEPLIERKRRLEDRIDNEEFSPEALPKAQAELVRLHNEIHKATTGRARGVFGALIGHGVKLTGGLIDAIAEGKGPVHRALWNNWYGMATGDRLIKYMTYRHLRDNLKLGKEAALHRVADYMQQLHRPSASVQQIGKTTGGAMFAGFAVDQSRILSNVLRDDHMALLRLIMLLSGWNSLAISSTGNSVEDYLESWALQHGVQRDGLSDTQAMAGGMFLPGGLGLFNNKNDLFRVSLGPAIWDIGMPQSRTGRSLATLAKGDSTNAGYNLAMDAFVGGLSKYVGADLFTILATGLSEKVDENGDPMQDMGDVAAWLGRMMVIPRFAPGSKEYGSLSRALSGTEVNLDTGQKVPFSRAIGDLFLQIKPGFDSRSRFRSAMLSQIRAHNGGLVAFKRAERLDEQLPTLLARGAMNADGSLNEERALSIIEQHRLENPTHYVGPDGVKVVESFSEDDISRQMDSAGAPKVIRTFKRQSLPLQISTYALWRSVDGLAPQRDPEWYSGIRTLLLEKLTAGRRFPIEDVQEVNLRVEEALNSGRLPPDAVEDLQTFRALLSRNVSARR